MIIGVQIMCMTLQEIVMIGRKRRTTPSLEFIEGDVTAAPGPAVRPQIVASAIRTLPTAPFLPVQQCI